MKILITGIAGFLGKNLINFLKKYELCGIDIEAGIIEGIKVYSSNEIETINFNPEIVVICHAAVASGGIKIENDILYEVNVSLTEKICKKFNNAFIIYVSTASIYEIDEKIISENSAINPQTEYAISKNWGEKIVARYNSVIVRLSSLYGIGMKENTLIPNYVNQALKNNLIEVWGKGTRLQNYVHVSDIAECVKLIIAKKEEIVGTTLLGVSTTEITNIEVANIISNIINAPVKFVNEDTSKSVKYNNKKTLQLLNWKPAIDIKTGIENYIHWKRKQF